MMCYIFLVDTICTTDDICINLVLASKGIDATLVDKRVERKASVPRLTGELHEQAGSA